MKARSLAHAIRGRIAAALFPAQTNPLPTAAQLRGYAERYLDLTLGGKVPFSTRLRLLLTGRLEILVQVKTDVVVQRAETAACCYALPPRWLEPARSTFVPLAGPAASAPLNRAARRAK